MERADRIELTLEALKDMLQGRHNFARFVDTGQSEHFVLVWNFRPNDVTHVEVTNRAIPGSFLPPLTWAQIDRLVALGFSADARPRFRADFSRINADRLAETIEHVFTILRSEPDFELAVGLGRGEVPVPDLGIPGIYTGMPRAPKSDADDDDSAGDPALLERIKQAQARYRLPDGAVLPVEPPYIVTCWESEGYGYFCDEAAIMLRSISLAMQAGDLTGAMAREAFLPYRDYRPEIYADDYEEWNDWGFPVCTDDMDEFMVSSITREADAAGIPGVGVPWHNLSPMSGEPLQVDSDEALEQLQEHFRGRYLIVPVQDPTSELPPDEAQRWFEEERNAARPPAGESNLNV